MKRALTASYTQTPPSYPVQLKFILKLFYLCLQCSTKGTRIRFLTYDYMTLINVTKQQKTLQFEILDMLILLKVVEILSQFQIV